MHYIIITSFLASCISQILGGYDKLSCSIRGCPTEADPILVNQTCFASSLRQDYPHGSKNSSFRRNLGAPLRRRLVQAVVPPAFLPTFSASLRNSRGGEQGHDLPSIAGGTACSYPPLWDKEKEGDGFFIRPLKYILKTPRCPRSSDRAAHPGCCSRRSGT